jgi:hypothetical protein
VTGGRRRARQAVKQHASGLPPRDRAIEHQASQMAKLPAKWPIGHSTSQSASRTTLRKCAPTGRVATHALKTLLRMRRAEHVTCLFARPQPARSLDGSLASVRSLAASLARLYRVIARHLLARSPAVALACLLKLQLLMLARILAGSVMFGFAWACSDFPVCPHFRLRSPVGLGFTTPCCVGQVRAMFAR